MIIISSSSMIGGFAGAAPLLEQEASALRHIYIYIYNIIYIYMIYICIYGASARRAYQVACGKKVNDSGPRSRLCGHESKPRQAHTCTRHRWVKSTVGARSARDGADAASSGSTGTECKASLRRTLSLCLIKKGQGEEQRVVRQDPIAAHRSARTGENY